MKRGAQSDLNDFFFFRSQGLINGYNLTDIDRRYLSLTKEQSVDALIRFQNSVRFAEPVTSELGVTLNGDCRAMDRYSTRSANSRLV